MRILRGAGIALAVLGGAAALLIHYTAPQTAPSDVLFVGGDIVTMAEPPVVEAIQTHRGYQERFPDYPRERRALIPFVL